MDADQAQRITDLIATNLTGSLLTDASNDAVIGLLTDERLRATRDQRVRAAAMLVAQLPEANLK